MVVRMALVFRISFYSVSFRLSTGKVVVAPAGDDPRPHDSYAAEPWSLESEICLGEIAISQESENADPRRRRSVPSVEDKLFQKRSFPFQVPSGFTFVEAAGPAL
jgi:hypothetical protein